MDDDDRERINGSRSAEAISGNISLSRPRLFPKSSAYSETSEAVTLMAEVSNDGRARSAQTSSRQPHAVLRDKATAISGALSNGAASVKTLVMSLSESVLRLSERQICANRVIPAVPPET